MGNAVKKSKKAAPYVAFDSIDGRHPLQKAVPESCVLYPVRKRSGGKVRYFNFNLAKEIGLLEKEHSDELTKELSDKLLETFSLVIINEFDQENNKKFPKDKIKEHPYMATRYLQLQHPDNLGLSSGDGRSIWNGSFYSGSKWWDFSSCGTGATKLSPATTRHNKFFETGDPSIAYGCGYSEIDEGFETLFFSEVMHLNHYATERCLAIIDFGNGIGITVRTHQNLLRPSHFFVHLKQGNYEPLKSVTDYYIQRQTKNRIWKDLPKTEGAKYKYLLQKVTEVFANLAADFEDNYIFCWLDWDGDNILMDGGIIDYGSVRQFGMYHHEYRFDDVERFSTSIPEQKQKARHIVQTFAQAMDFLIHKKKKPLKDFSQHGAVEEFEKVFQRRKTENLLKKVGYSQKSIEYLMRSKKDFIMEFSKAFRYFETQTSKKGKYKIPDGIMSNAIYCMRDILRELPQLLMLKGDLVSNEDFIDVARSSYALKKDFSISEYRDKNIKAFQKNYLQMAEAVATNQKTDRKSVLLELGMRSSVINKFDRITGDAITNIVHTILGPKKAPSPEAIHKMVREFIAFQQFDPDTLDEDLVPKKAAKKVKEFLEIVRELREGI